MMARHIAGAPAAPAGTYDADVVILSLDRAEDSVAAIRSALAQTGVSHHVFVVDQGSRPEALAQLAAAVTDHADATLVALDCNCGVAAGRNLGSALGHGRVIFGLDNDAEFATTDTLARAVNALDADASLAAIGCRILLHANGADDVSSWGYPAGLLPHAAEAFDTVTFVGAGHAIRRAAWDGYDEVLFFCWEEYDYCLRAIEHGWRIRYRGDIAVRHKVSAERRLSWSGNRWFHYVRNRLYIGAKWGSPPLTLLPRFGFYLLKALRHGLLRQTLQAWREAMQLAARIPAQRHSAYARAYLQANDAAHRGDWLTRPWREGPRISNRSRSSSGKIAGLSTR